MVSSKQHTTHILLLLYIFYISFGAVTSHGGHEEEEKEQMIENKFEDQQSGYKAQWVIHEGWINFTVSVPTKGWVGIGFSPSGDPKGDDYIIGYNTTITDCFVKPNGNIALHDMDIGGHDDVIDKNVQHDFVQNITKLSFSRRLDTSDLIADHIIENKKMWLKWAYGDDIDTVGNLSANDTHSNRFMLNFFDEIIIPDDPNMLLIRNHGYMMCIFVMLIMTASIITSRYLKKVLYWWFYLHAGLSVAGLVFMITSLSLVFTAHNNKLVPSWHSAFGIIFIILVGMQTLIGLYSHFTFDKFRREPPAFPDKTHWWLGRVVYGVGLLNIALGLGMLGNYRSLGWVFYALWIVVVAIVVGVLQKTIGQTHETLYGGHKVLEGAVQDEVEDDKEHGGGAKRLKQQRKSAEFMVMFFVPAITGILVTFMGVVMLI